MSYDLSFAAPDGESPLMTDFLEYFEGRDHYAYRGTDVWYQNEDTGVYFSFDLAPEDENTDDDEELLEDIDFEAHAAFNINFFRPPYFALEALPEVKAFVERFSFRVDDPQICGMGRGAFSDEGFLSGWNAGNDLAHHSIVSAHEHSEFLTRPDAELNKIWNWNRGRDEYQRTLGVDVFVPRIVFVRSSGELLSAVVWGDAIPALLPRVDAVLVARRALAPRRLLRRKPDCAIVPWSELAPVVSDCPRHDHLFSCVELYYEQPPERLASWVRGLSVDDRELEIVPNDQVLSEELVENAGDLEVLEIAEFGPEAEDS